MYASIHTLLSEIMVLSTADVTAVPYDGHIYYVIEGFIMGFCALGNI